MTDTPFTRISAEQAKEMLDQGATLADIRDPDSFASSHIDGAQPLSNTNVEDFLRDNDPDQPLIVYCYHGNSSQPAAAYLHERGYDDVYSMDGGFDRWRQLFPETLKSGDSD